MTFDSTFFASKFVLGVGQTLPFHLTTTWAWDLLEQGFEGDSSRGNA